MAQEGSSDRDRLMFTAAAYYYDPFPDEHLNINYGLPQFDWVSTGTEVVDVFKDRVRDRIVAITGPSSGSIGGATVFSFASAFPNTIVLISRSISSVQPVIDTIRSRYKEDAPILHFVSCDLSSQASIRQAAANISNLVPRIDILVNNAATPPGPYQETADGVESQFAINHLGHFLLTNLLTPRILDGPRPVDSPKPRVVTLSSSAHRNCTQSPAENYNFSNGMTNGILYDPRSAYIQSKAANVLFARAFAQKLARRGVLSFSVHPGSIETGLQDRIPTAIVEQTEGARVAEARVSISSSPGPSGTRSSVSSAPPTSSSMSAAAYSRSSVSSAPPTAPGSRRGSEQARRRQQSAAETSGANSQFLRRASEQSGMSANFPLVAEEVYAVQRARRKTVDQGCATTLVAALDPRLEASTGVYLEDGKVVEDGLAGVMDRDGETDRLWELSERLVGEVFDWS